MPKFKVAVAHSLEAEIAVEKLKGFSEKVRQSAAVDMTDISEEWDNEGNLSFSFKAMGMKISGRMKTEPEQIIVNGDLPFAAAMFRGAIETQIREKIEEALRT